MTFYWVTASQFGLNIKVKHELWKGKGNIAVVP